MGKHERRVYLQAIQKRYRQSDRATKQTILNEFCEVCGYARKYAIRLLNRKTQQAAPPAKRPGPKRKYRPEVLMEPLRRIWFASDQLCGKRLGGNTDLVAALRRSIRPLGGQRAR